jgi:Na+-transporting NADH:ubiquinone oxidoreductase subunit NqrC
MDQIPIILFIVLVLVFVLFRTSSDGVVPIDKQIRILYRQTARYAVASLQDESPVVKSLHANYAMGYLMALKDLATTGEFARATGDNLISFERKIASIQDASTVNLVGDCPDLIPNEDPGLLRAMYIQI